MKANPHGVHAAIMPRLFANKVHAEVDADRRVIVMFRPIPKGFEAEIRAAVAAIDPTIGVEPAPKGSPTGAQRRAARDRAEHVAQFEAAVARVRASQA